MPHPANAGQARLGPIEESPLAEQADAVAPAWQSKLGKQLRGLGVPDAASCGAGQRHSGFASLPAVQADAGYYSSEIPIAIVFNPVIPIHLGKETWVPIDVIIEYCTLRA